VVVVPIVVELEALIKSFINIVIWSLPI